MCGIYMYIEILAGRGEGEEGYMCGTDAGWEGGRGRRGCQCVDGGGCVCVCRTVYVYMCGTGGRVADWEGSVHCMVWVRGKGGRGRGGEGRGKEGLRGRGEREEECRCVDGWGCEGGGRDAG